MKSAIENAVRASLIGLSASAILAAASLTSVAAMTVPGDGDASAQLADLTNDIAPVEGLPVPSGDGLVESAPPAGYNLIGGLSGWNVVGRPAYTLRLVSNGQGSVEKLRLSAQRAAARVPEMHIVVAAGTVPDQVPDRSPVVGEILLSWDSTAECPGSTWGGCGGPKQLSVEGDRVTLGAGRIWANPGTMYNASQGNLDHLIAHELGHALGLGHYDPQFEGAFQTMNGASQGYANQGVFRSGDLNGLRHLGPLSPRLASTGAVTATTIDGHPSLFVIDSSGTTWWGDSNGTVTSWTSLGGTLQASPGVVFQQASHRIDLFGISPGGVLYQRTYSGGMWGAWVSRGGSGLAGGVTAMRTPDGLFRVFVTNSAGALMQGYAGASGVWTWQNLGGSILGRPAAVHDPAAGRFDVFGVGTDGAIYQRTYGTTGGTWTPWAKRVGTGLQGGLSAVKSSDGVFHIFGINTSGDLRQAYGTATGSWGFQSLGGSVRGTPAVTLRADVGRYDVFAQGLNGHVYEKWYQTAWTAWAPLR